MLGGTKKLMMLWTSNSQYPKTHMLASWYGRWFRNPVNSPVDMVNIPFTGFHTSQVVQDFFHQQYDIQKLNIQQLVQEGCHSTTLLEVLDGAACASAHYRLPRTWRLTEGVGKFWEKFIREMGIFHSDYHNITSLSKNTPPPHQTRDRPLKTNMSPENSNMFFRCIPYTEIVPLFGGTVVCFFRFYFWHSNRTPL